VIQHVEPEGPYDIGEALEEHGVALDVRRVYQGDEVPSDLEGFSGLVVMGGPMSVTSDAGFASRRQELSLLVRAIDEGVPTLGVCLGAQLLAQAAGGHVFAGHGAEIGFGVVRLEPAATEDYLLSSLAPFQTVLHWHGDTFALPAGAVRLCANDLYENQAFCVGGTAWGFQFHFEVDREAVNAFVEAFEGEVIASGLDPRDILAESPESLGRLVDLREQVCTRFALLVAAFQPVDDSLVNR
jgi:GMP synthase-like glutamine amidotransferase